jgi:PTS system fructose-specific IIC component/PTS system nitrogen regulatory IIA component
MPFSELMGRAHLWVGLKAEDKWMALDALCDRLVSAGLVTPDRRDSVLDALLDRERSLSTGMERGLAIPHAFVAGLDETLLILATAPDGVPWDALDGAPSRLLAVFVAPATAAARLQHLAILAQISGWFVALPTGAIEGARDEDALRALLP